MRQVSLQGPGGLILVGLLALVLAAPWLELVPLGPASLPPLGFDGAGSAHPLGTDGAGGDLASALTGALGLSMMITVAALACQVVLGVGLGLIAATHPVLGLPIRVVARGLQMLGLPLLAIAALALIRAGEWEPNAPVIALALGIFGWAPIALGILGALKSARHAPHVQAAREIGMAPWRVLSRHGTGAMAGPALAGAALGLVETAMAELLLGFLGLGLGAASLGGFFAEAASSLTLALWWPALVAALGAILWLLALILIADHVARQTGGAR
ncbi:MAG: ABC transporter permease subunit [Pseudomonadota bacterium]